MPQELVCFFALCFMGLIVTGIYGLARLYEVKCWHSQNLLALEKGKDGLRAWAHKEGLANARAVTGLQNAADEEEELEAPEEDRSGFSIVVGNNPYLNDEDEDE